jgi:methionyl-tRNA formyltransferase
MNGDRTTSVCIMQMDEGLDSGNIILQQEYNIDEFCSALELTQNLAKIGGELLITSLHMIENQYFIPLVQDSKGVTYASKIIREDEKIHWTDSAWLIHCKIRSLSPKPGAYFSHTHQQDIKIIKSTYKSGDDAYSYLEEMAAYGDTLPKKQHIDIERYLQARPGLVLNKMLAIKCGDGGILFPQMLQRAGGKIIKVEDFILGYHIEVGEILN